jgi:hypothetical protein
MQDQPPVAWLHGSRRATGTRLPQKALAIILWLRLNSPKENRMRKIIRIFALPAMLVGALALFVATGCQPQSEEQAPQQDNPQQEAPADDTEQAVLDAKPYPLDYCLVTNEKLGSMGEPVSKVFQGQEFKVCCAGCIDTIEKDVPGYLAKLEEATQNQE